MKRERYGWAYAAIGCGAPQLQIQILPLQWGIGGGIGTHKVSLVIGPIAVAIQFRLSDFKTECIAKKIR